MSELHHDPEAADNPGLFAGITDVSYLAELLEARRAQVHATLAQAGKMGIEHPGIVETEGYWAKIGAATGELALLGWLAAQAQGASGQDLDAELRKLTEPS